MQDEEDQGNPTFSKPSQFPPTLSETNSSLSGFLPEGDSEPEILLSDDFLFNSTQELNFVSESQSIMSFEQETSSQQIFQEFTTSNYYEVQDSTFQSSNEDTFTLNTSQSPESTAQDILQDLSTPNLAEDKESISQPSPQDVSVTSSLDDFESSSHSSEVDGFISDSSAGTGLTTQSLEEDSFHMTNTSESVSEPIHTFEFISDTSDDLESTTSQESSSPFTFDDLTNTNQELVEPSSQTNDSNVLISNSSDRLGTGNSPDGSQTSSQSEESDNFPSEEEPTHSLETISASLSSQSDTAVSSPEVNSSDELDISPVLASGPQADSSISVSLPLPVVVPSQPASVISIVPSTSSSTGSTTIRLFNFVFHIKHFSIGNIFFI